MKKSIFTLALLSLSLGLHSQAAPFMAIGDGAELFLTGNLSVRADDNIFLNQDNVLLGQQKTSDTIFDVAPGAELTFGKDAELKGAFTLVDDWTRYADNRRLDTNLASVDFRSNYDDSKMKLQLTAGYHELNQNTPDVRGLIRRNVLAAGGNAEVEVSQITSASGGIDVDREDYRRPGYSDSTTYTVPLNVYYKWTPKVDLSAGYRYRDYEANQGQSSADHFFNLGARGDFTPKLSGTFAIGVNTRRLSGTNPTTLRSGGTDSQLGLDASFSYEVSAKTNLQLGASNDFGTTPQGQQQKNFTVNAAVSSKISAEWEANAGISFRATGYGTRTDDYYEGTLGASYVINANIRLIGAYVYRKYNSDIATSEFTNNVFSLAANFRY